jgi:uncharacterized protein YndB with AHSA1/START domain
MSNIRIMREYPHPPAKVWRALTDPDVIPLWTSSGRGGRPEGFSPVVGTRFRFVAKPRPGWRGIVECEVLEAREPSLLRYSWVGDENGAVSQVTYRLEPDHSRTRFTFEHAGFRGLGGFLVAKLVLGPARKKMFDVGLPAALVAIDEEGVPAA